MNVAFRHVVLLRSFLQNPAVHFAAAQNPSLFGGPFMHLPPSAAPGVKALLERTMDECACLIGIANDIKQLDEALQAGARGFSMSEFYSRVPSALQGLVEFIYDTNNHPKIRFYEELLYDEDLCSRTQEVMLSADRAEDRRFFMSTPRLDGPERLRLKLPFRDRRLDVLASMRVTPQSLGAVTEILEIPADRRGLFGSFFAESAPARRNIEYRGEGIRLRYFGHACVLLQSEHTSILLDPLLSWGSGEHGGGFTVDDLPDHIDYVVLSHNHQDHLNPETLLQLRHRIGAIVVPNNNSGSIVDPSMRLALRHLGFERVISHDAFDSTRVADGVITSLPFPGEHVDLDVYSRQGIHIELAGRRFAFLVDSDGREPRLFQRIVRRIGSDVDALFIGMECHGAPLTWLYGPLLTKAISRRDDESRRLSGLNCERAWSVLKQVRPKRVYVYAMGQEPWLRWIMGLRYSPDSIQLKEMNALLERCASEQIAAEQLCLSKEMEF